MSISEQACTLACLLLHDDGIAVTAEKINTVVKSANIAVESYWPGLFAKLAENRNINDLIFSVGSGGGGGGAPVGFAPQVSADASAPASAAAEEKEEEKEESDVEIGFSLFEDE